MLLSSYNRLLRYCGADDILTDNANNRRQLMTWLPAVSKNIENWLNRGIQYQTGFTEYFDVRFHTNEFYPKYIPLINITDVYVDMLGMWDGRESQLSSISYHPGINGNSLVLIFARPFETKKGLRLNYDGGLALDAVQSVYVVTETGGTFTPGKFVHGETSDAVGMTVADTGTSMTIEVLYGAFTIGETVTEWDTETGPGNSSATAVLVSATSLSLAESYPEIVNAVELQIRYMKKNKDRFEQQTIGKDGTSNRRVGYRGMNDNELQPEVKMMLGYLRRIAI
jgi:hypothetical protein